MTSRASGAFALSLLTLSYGRAVPRAAQSPGERFVVDPFWPRPLPNNWILGQVANVDVDAHDHVWIVHRPGSLTDREVGAAQKPPWSKCCVAAPPVLEFDQNG